MKRCAHCKELKDLTEFAYSNKLLKTHQKHCRDCMRKFNRQSYERRSEKKKQEIEENRKAQREAIRQYIWDYLSTHPCVDCGESDPKVLEFDHVRGRKKSNIGNLATQGYSISSVRKEIAKCEVRCANCHRRKTADERGWYEW